MRSNSKKSNSNRRRQNNQRGGGRTFNVPFPTKDGHTFIPESPTYNNAVYIGEPCIGDHCGIPVYPSISNIINNNLKYGNSDMPPGANFQYPVINRLGNSPGENLPGIGKYDGTQLNPGPFDIRCIKGGNRKKKSLAKNNKSKNNKSKSKNNRSRNNRSRNNKFRKNRN